MAHNFFGFQDNRNVLCPPRPTRHFSVLASPVTSSGDLVVPNAFKVVTATDMVVNIVTFDVSALLRMNDVTSGVHLGSLDIDQPCENSFKQSA